MKRLVRASLAAALSFSCAHRPEVGTATLDARETEVWSFETVVDGTIEGECDRVRLEGGRTEVVARSRGDRFTGAVRLDPGINTVYAVCEREGQERRSAAGRFVVRVPDEPKAWVRVSGRANEIHLDASPSERSPSSRAPLREMRWFPMPGNPGPLVTREGLLLDGEPGSSIVLRPPAVDGVYRVQVRVTDARGRSSRAAGMFTVQEGRVEIPDLAHEPPAWLDRAVLYGVVPHVFGQGRLDDVRVRLDDLRDLGVDTLWFSPLMEAPDDDFGYAPIDFFRVRQRFGGERAFAELVDEAHARGMKVIVDVVVNHTSDRHRYFEGALQNHPSYLRRYQRDEKGDFVHYFDWENLPNLDYDDPDVRRFVTDAFAWWIHRFDVDGFRVDAAWAVRERRPDFWPVLRRELQRIRPDLLFIAEGSAVDPYFFEHGFDVAYDWTRKPGDWAWKDVFDDPEQAGASLERVLARTDRAHAPDARVLRFLENNDTEERFVTRHGSRMVVPAAALLLTLPGLPCIFTGQEVGAEYVPYDEGPALDFADPHRLRPVYRRLIRLRKNQRALHSRKWTLLGTLGDPSVLAYVRHGQNRSEDIVVLLNFGADPASVTIPESAGSQWTNSRLQDLWRGETIDPGSRIEIAGHGVRLVRVDQNLRRGPSRLLARDP